MRTGQPEPADERTYDQFAYFDPKTRGPKQPPPLSLARLGGGSFAWDDFILKQERGLWQEARLARRENRPSPPGAYDPTFRLSDHYPLWLELSVCEADGGA